MLPRCAGAFFLGPDEQRASVGRVRHHRRPSTERVQSNDEQRREMLCLFGLEDDLYTTSGAPEWRESEGVSIPNLMDPTPSASRLDANPINQQWQSRISTRFPTDTWTGAMASSTALTGTRRGGSGSGAVHADPRNAWGRQANSSRRGKRDSPAPTQLTLRTLL